jgi:hypothetical protein
MAVAAYQHAVVVRVLRAMCTYPDATSVAKLRAYLGVRMGDANGAVAYILQSGFAKPGTRGKPYHLTEAGCAFLMAHEATP